MKSAFVFRLALLLGTASLGVTLAHAQDPAIKARMEQRLGSVNALKDRGIVGENNQGFLEPRGNASGDDQRIIGEENADRRSVYAAIAAKTGAPPDVVGRQRAQQLASLARPGHWIQDPSGAWKQR